LYAKALKYINQFLGIVSGYGNPYIHISSRAGVAVVTYCVSADEQILYLSLGQISQELS